MSRRYCADDARRLTLHCLSHRGLPVEILWQWPGDSAEASFAEVVTSWLADDVELFDAFSAVQLICAGPASHPAWWIRNRSPILKCTVGGVTLPQGRQVHIQEGDEIEIGLTAFETRFELLTSSGPVHQSAKIIGPDTEGDLQPAPSYLDFDLTDLASLYADPEKNTLSNDPLQDLSDQFLMNDFSQELAFSSVSARHEEKERSPHDEQDNIPTDILDQATPAKAEEYSEDAIIAEMAEDTLLASLNEQYLKTVQDPYYVENSANWTGILFQQKQDINDPLQGLMAAAGPESHVSDLLGQSDKIADVMANFDALGSSDILDPEPYPDVMQLFAPEHMHKTSNPHLMPSRHIPALTRLEHHAAALDSPLQSNQAAGPDIEKLAEHKRELS